MFWILVDISWHLLISSQPASGHLDIHSVDDPEVYPEFPEVYQKGPVGGRVHPRRFQKRGGTWRRLDASWGSVSVFAFYFCCCVVSHLEGLCFCLFVCHLPLLIFEWKRYASHFQGIGFWCDVMFTTLVCCFWVKEKLCIRKAEGNRQNIPRKRHFMYISTGNRETDNYIYIYIYILYMI